MQRLDYATEYLNNTRDLEIEQKYLTAQINSRKNSMPDQDILELPGSLFTEEKNKSQRIAFVKKTSAM